MILSFFHPSTLVFLSVPGPPFPHPDQLLLVCLCFSTPCSPCNLSSADSCWPLKAQWCSCLCYHFQNWTAPWLDRLSLFSWGGQDQAVEQLWQYYYQLKCLQKAMPRNKTSSRTLNNSIRGMVQKAKSFYEDNNISFNDSGSDFFYNCGGSDTIIFSKYVPFWLWCARLIIIIS